MKNLANMLATDAGEDKVLQRLQVIDMARGILNSIAIDTDGEEYRYENLSLSGIKDVVDATCNMLSAVTDIPQTILFGRSPAGMNSTGESDFENFYNMVENIQKQNMKKNTRTVIDLILQQGVVEGRIQQKPKYKVKFAALWSMSEAEQANVDKTKADTEHVKAQTEQVYMENNVLDPTDVRNSLAKEGRYELEEDSTDNNLNLPEDTFDIGIDTPISVGGIEGDFSLMDAVNKAWKEENGEDDNVITVLDVDNEVEDKMDGDKIAETNYEMLHLKMDGGPGSGNWGHAGRPGKRGGSAGGGGKANRTGTKESGFSSKAKERIQQKTKSSGSSVSFKKNYTKIEQLYLKEESMAATYLAQNGMDVAEAFALMGENKAIAEAKKKIDAKYIEKEKRYNKCSESQKKMMNMTADEVNEYIENCKAKTIPTTLNTGSKAQHVVYELGLNDKPKIVSKE